MLHINEAFSVRGDRNGVGCGTFLGWVQRRTSFIYTGYSALKQYSDDCKYL